MRFDRVSSVNAVVGSARPHAATERHGRRLSALLLGCHVLVACGSRAPAPILPTLPGDGAVTAPQGLGVAPAAPAPTRPAGTAWRPPTPLAPPANVNPKAIGFPKPTSIVLPNGLTVVFVKTAGQPVVSVQLAVKAGRMHEPLARLGLADATGDMLLRGGTTTREPNAVVRAVEQAGGTLSINTGYEATVLACSALSTVAAMCVDTVSELVQRPAFASARLTPLLQHKMAETAQQKQQPAMLAAMHAQNLLWGDRHVRGWVANESHWSQLTRDDLMTWHKTWFRPNNAVMVVAGNFDVAVMRARVTTAFGKWAKAALPPRPTYAAPARSGLAIRLVDAPGLRQAQVRVAQLGIAHDDPRLFELLVGTELLGGDAAARVQTALAAAGMSEVQANAAFDRNVDRGTWMLSAATPPAQAVAVVEHLQRVLRELALTPPTAPEVGAAATRLAGAYSVRMQSTNDLASALLVAELHGFAPSYTSQYPVQLANVAPGAVGEALSRVVNPQNAAIVIVADAKDVEPELKRRGWQFEKVSYASAIGPSAQPATVVVDAKAAAGALAVLDGALQAKGGEPALRAIARMRMAARGSTLISGRKATVEITRTLETPAKMRIDATLTLGKAMQVTVVVDGNQGWNLDPGGLSALDAQALASVEFERWRDPEFILLRHKDKGLQVAPMSDEMIHGRGHAVVRMVSPMGVNVTLYIDRQTKLLTRMSYEEGGVTSVDEFSDYRTVQGLAIAHKRVSTSVGRATELTLTRVELNPTLTPDTFAKPQGGANAK